MRGEGRSMESKDRRKYRVVCDLKPMLCCMRAVFPSHKPGKVKKRNAITRKEEPLTSSPCE